MKYYRMLDILLQLWYNIGIGPALIAGHSFNLILRPATFAFRRTQYRSAAMKKTIAAIAATAALAATSYGGYWAYNEYTVLSTSDIQAVQMYLVQSQYQAYKLGEQACNKGT
jgi:hypothetical protein